MVLYELVCISSHVAKKFLPTQSLVETASSIILRNGGVVRTVDYWGCRNLPQKMKTQSSGDYWTLRFDSNPPTVAALNERLRLDPRVLRWTTLKIGSTLAAVTKPAEDPTVHFSRTVPDRARMIEADVTARGSGRASGRLLPGAPR